MEIVLRILEIIGALVVLAWIGLIAIAFVAWLIARRHPEEICSCLEIAGDNPDCPVHADLWAQREGYPRPTHFELDLRKVVRGWPVSGPCASDSTERVHDYLRRRSKPN